MDCVDVCGVMYGLATGAPVATLPSATPRAAALAFATGATLAFAFALAPVEAAYRVRRAGPRPIEADDAACFPTSHAVFADADADDAGDPAADACAAGAPTTLAIVVASSLCAWLTVSTVCTICATFSPGAGAE